MSIIINYSGGTKELGLGHHGLVFAAWVGDEVTVRSDSQAVDTCELTSQPTPSGEPLAFEGASFTPDVPGHYAISVTLASGTAIRFDLLATETELQDEIVGERLARHNELQPLRMLDGLTSVAIANPTWDGTLATLPAGDLANHGLSQRRPANWASSGST